MVRMNARASRQLPPLELQALFSFRVPPVIALLLQSSQGPFCGRVAPPSGKVLRTPVHECKKTEPVAMATEARAPSTITCLMFGKI